MTHLSTKALIYKATQPQLAMELQEKSRKILKERDRESSVSKIKLQDTC